MNLSYAFGKTLRRIRIEHGLTQEELGFEADLRRAYISSLELGQKEPSLQTIQKLSAAFGMTSSKLIAEVEKSEKKESLS